MSERTWKIEKRLRWRFEGKAKQVTAVWRATFFFSKNKKPASILTRTYPLLNDVYGHEWKTATEDERGFV